MKIKLMTVALTLAWGAFATWTMAGPPSKCSGHKASTAKAEDKAQDENAKAKPSCHKGAKQASDKAKGCCAKGARGAKTASAKGGCDKKCHKSAKLAGDKSKGCCAKGAKGAKTASAKGGCDKKCHKSAKLAGDKSKGCCAKGAKTASAKGGCSMSAKLAGDKSKGCCAKGAKTASAKGGCSKSAKLAGDKSKGCCAKGAKTASAKGCCSKGKGLKGIDAVLASIPTMTYRVGKEDSPCGKRAEQMAKDANAPIHYVVGEKDFVDHGEALVALASALDSKIATLKAVRFAVGDKCVACPMQAGQLAKAAKTKMTYRVGGFDFDTQKEAVRVAGLIEKAENDTRLTYKVGEKTFTAADRASKEAVSSGTKLVYVIGAEETCCSKTATTMLADAKIRSIVEAAASASKSS